MSYQFPPDLEQLLQEQMAAGRYASESDLIRDALNALRQQNEDLSAIKAGLEDMERGRVRSVDDIATDICQQHGWTP